MLYKAYKCRVHTWFSSIATLNQAEESETHE